MSHSSSSSRPSLSSLYQDAFTCLARYLSLGSLATVCRLSREMHAKVSALPQLHRLWAWRADRPHSLPSANSALSRLISKLRWNGSNLASDCDRDRATLMQRLPNLLLLHYDFRSPSWQDSFEEQLSLCRCIRGYDPDATLEYRSHIRTLHLRWEFGGPPAASVPPMLGVASCLPHLSDLTLTGLGDGCSCPAEMLSRLRPLRTLKRFVMSLQDQDDAACLSDEAMDDILSLPLLTRLELQEGRLSAGCVRAMLSDAAEQFRARVVILKRSPSSMRDDAKSLLPELEKLCPRLQP